MKKLTAFILALILILSIVSCSKDDDVSGSSEASSQTSNSVSEPVSEEKSEEVSAVSEEPSSEPTSEEVSEPVSEEPVQRTYFNFLEGASAFSVDGRVTGGSVVVFTNNEAIADGNLRWSFNVVLEKTNTPFVYSVVAGYGGTGADPEFTLEDGQICLAVHHDDVKNVNKDGYDKAKSLSKGSLIAIVGIEQKDIQVLKEYEDGESLEYVEQATSYLTSQFVYYGADYDYTTKVTDKNIIKLTKVNEKANDGDSVLYTADYAFNIGDACERSDLDNFAVLIVEYTHITEDGVNNFKYTKKALYEPNTNIKKSTIAIPEDGYAIVVHKSCEDVIPHLSKIKDSDLIYACGIQTRRIEWDFYRLDGELKIDGEFDELWKEYLIEHIDYDNVNWDYSQFKPGEYNCSGDLYATYDDKNLYFCVVAQMPYTPVFKDTNLWNATAIQAQIIDQSPISEYITEHCQYGAGDKLAVQENHVKQYGFGLNTKGNTAYEVYYGKTFGGELGVKYDKDAQTIIYEVTIPWEEANVTTPIEEGTVIAFSISINARSVEGGAWENVQMRESGGIIIMNDFTKMPIVTLK